MKELYKAERSLLNKLVNADYDKQEVIKRWIGRMNKMMEALDK